MNILKCTTGRFIRLYVIMTILILGWYSKVHCASVDSITGEITQTFDLFNFAGRDFTFVYQSMDYYRGPAGPKWRHPLIIYLKNRIPKDGFKGDMFFECNERGGYVFPVEEDHFGSWSADSNLKLVDHGFIVTIGTDKYLFDKNLKIIQVSNSVEESFIKFEQRGEYITSAVDESGNKVLITYNDGHVDSIIAPNGDKFLFTYDDIGNLAAIIYPDKTSYRFTYKGTLMVTKVNRNGEKIQYEYDDQKQLIHTIGPAGKVASFSYPERSGNRIKRVHNDAEGNVTEYYREFGKDTMTTRKVDALGRTTDLLQDKLTGNLISRTDASGIRTDYKYNEKGKLIETSSSDGTKTGINYDSKGRLIEERIADGTIISYEYLPNNGKRATTVTVDGKKSITENDKHGNITKTVMPNGETSFFDYDSSGRPVKFVDSSGRVTLIEYDSTGRLTITDSEGNRQLEPLSPEKH